ncbi:hypothetical protein AB0M50_04940 [Nonomuraea fuscirosea]|uniref:hypothetical protein n=1 Tax=Nonomuraea fuscirosea TaxID=1291556 RepID=UPI003444C058
MRPLHAHFGRQLDLGDVAALARVLDGRRTTVPAADQRRLLTVFVAATRSGEIPGRGGGPCGEVHACVRRLFLDAVEVTWADVNGQAAALLSRDGMVVTVLALNTSDRGIDQVLWMMNPAKLSAASIGQDPPPDDL